MAKGEQIVVRVAGKMRAELVATAAMEEITEAELVRDILSEYLPARTLAAAERQRRNAKLESAGVASEKTVNEAISEVIKILSKGHTPQLPPSEFAGPRGRAILDILRSIWYSIEPQMDEEPTTAELAKFARIRDRLLSITPISTKIDTNSTDDIDESIPEPRPYPRRKPN